MKTNAGNDYVAASLGNAAATGAGTGAMRPADYIGLSESATAPAATDTALPTELTGTGLARKQATYAHTAGAASYTLTATFTSADPTTRTPAKIGVFNASGGGTMVFESLLVSPGPIATGDVLTVTETVSL